MKIRLDFVTNSSSSAFVALLIKSPEVAAQIYRITQSKKSAFRLHHKECVGEMEVNRDTVYLVGEADELLSYDTVQKLKIWDALDRCGVRTERQVAADAKEINRLENAIKAVRFFLPKLSSSDEDSLWDAIETAYNGDKIGFELWEDSTDGYDERRPETLGRWKQNQPASSPDDFVIKKGKLVEYKGRAADVIIPNGVKEIAADCFTRVDSMRSVSIPDSVQRLNDWTFYRCNNLKKVIISDSVELIGNPFKYCDKLCDANGLLIVNGVLLDAQKQKNITLSIPDGVKRIASGVFREHHELRQVTIPEGVTEIGEQAFQNCINLNRISLPETLRKIGAEAFSRCSALEKVVLPEGITELGNRTFADSALMEINIPESLIHIGSDVFRGCKKIK